MIQNMEMVTHVHYTFDFMDVCVQTAMKIEKSYFN